MAVTIEQVRAALEPEEPDYRAAKELGPEALPHLKALTEEGNPSLTAKATYLASLIGGEAAHAVVASAAASEYPAVRVAAAAATRHLAPGGANELLTRLITDPDTGVRHEALRAAPAEMSPELRAHVERIAEAETTPVLHAASLKALGRTPPVPLTARPEAAAAAVGGKGGGLIGPAVPPGGGTGAGAMGKGGGSIRLTGPVPLAAAAGRGGGDLQGAGAAKKKPTPRKAKAAKAAKPRKSTTARGTKKKSRKPPTTPK
jgi:hypothetical protein